MGKPRRANRDLVKAMNRNLVLNIVRQQGPLSRTQLTEISGLSVGAVSQISNELLDENWLTSAGESDYTGGRRQEMLRLNPKAGCVIGLKLMENRVVCAITDLEAQVLHYTEAQLDYDHSVQAVSSGLIKAIENLMQQAQVSAQNILGVGIGLAGVIDYQRGIVNYSPYFHWRDVPLADMIQQQIHFPVYLENDVNTLTVAEQLFGMGHNISDFVVITIGRGIGMGMILNHQLYQGARGGVGELGHITVDPNGAACDCGKNGCLEAVAADPAIVRYVQNALTEGSPSQLEPQILDFPAIITAAHQGDELAQAALARSGQFLGIGLSMVVNILHPALIVISGEGVIAGDYRLKPMFDTLRDHAFNGLLADVEIVVKPTDEQIWAQGAASLVVGKVFEPPLVSM